jgi:hypothetical protein
LDFGDAVDKRLKQLGELNSGKTIHRRTKFGSIEGVLNDNPYVHSTYAIIFSTPRITRWKAEGWGTIRWKLRDIGPLRRVPTWWEAFNSLYGLPVGEIPVQVWKALPWTWLTDWFANISEALEVSKNLVSYEPSHLCRMYKVTSTDTLAPVILSPSKQWLGMSIQHEGKYRDVLSIHDITGVHLRVPFLDPFKLSVLGALTIVKIRRRLS